MHDAFDEIRAREIEPFVKDLKLMKIAVSAAPLVGLLSTVTGMLATFNALAAGSGGQDDVEDRRGHLGGALPRRQGSSSRFPDSSSTT